MILVVRAGGVQTAPDGDGHCARREGSAADGPPEETVMGSRRHFLTVTAAGLAAAAAPARAADEPTTTPRAEVPAVPEPSGMPRDAMLINMRREGGYALGVKVNDGVLDVAAAGRALGMPFPSDMDDLLQNGRGPALRALVGAVGSAPDRRFVLAEGSIAYAPVVTRPEKIIMMGFNYRRHAEETGTPVPQDPVLFNKYNNTLNHHGGTITLPTRAAREFDYETELVIVFGRECRDVREADALDYVAGYCTGNDFSARDLQTLTSQAMIGKTSDGFAPLGPYLVTADRVRDPNDLKLRTLVNGKVRQDWSTNDMIFNCRQLISFASKVMVSELEGLGELRFRLA